LDFQPVALGFALLLSDPGSLGSACVTSAMVLASSSAWSLPLQAPGLHFVREDSARRNRIHGARTHLSQRGEPQINRVWVGNWQLDDKSSLRLAVLWPLRASERRWGPCSAQCCPKRDAHMLEVLGGRQDHQALWPYSCHQVGLRRQYPMSHTYTNTPKWVSLKSPGFSHPKVKLFQSIGGIPNNVLLIKIEGPVWCTIYHHLPVVKGVNKPLY